MSALKRLSDLQIQLELLERNSKHQDTVVTHLDLLICGYLRETEDEYELYMNIPTGIAKIICDLYPLLIFKFGDCKEDAFKISKDGTILQGNDPRNNKCFGHAIYADLGKYSEIGLNKGVYLWSIKFLGGEWSYEQTADCYASIGVTSQRNEQLINNAYTGDWTSHWLTKDGCNSYYRGMDHWHKNEIITMKLNCNDWTVEYYKDKKLVQSDKIESNQSYFLAVFCCADRRYTHM